MSDTYSPTSAMIAAARRGLALVEAGRGGDGLRPATIAWARRVARGESLTAEKVRKMAAWLARHAVDKRPGWDDDGRETPGYVAHLLWFDNGDGAGRAWAERQVAAMDGAPRKRVKVRR